MSADTRLPEEMSKGEFPRPPSGESPVQRPPASALEKESLDRLPSGAGADELDEYDDEYDDQDGDFERPYRSLSKAAMFAFVLALVSLPLLWLFVFAEELFYIVLPLPLIAVGLGITALLKIRRYPLELTGKIPALLAIVLSIVAVVAGVVTQRYIYTHEVPNGYQRITWYDLKPHGDERRFPLPRKAFELAGKRVFIKGYVHPSVSGTGPVKTFMLVGDMGTCCFGGMPKLTERVDVLLEGDLTAQYSQRKRKLGGVLELNVNPNDPRTFYKPDDGSMGPYYVLHVDYLK